MSQITEPTLMLETVVNLRHEVEAKIMNTVWYLCHRSSHDHSKCIIFCWRVSAFVCISIRSVSPLLTPQGAVKDTNPKIFPLTWSSSPECWYCDIYTLCVMLDERKNMLYVMFLCDLPQLRYAVMLYWFLFL